MAEVWSSFIDYSARTYIQQETKAVFVSNISPNATEKTVSDFFSFCGKITKLTLRKYVS